MADEILMNDKIKHFNEKDLPCLIHYSPKTGGSHFTVTMIADLFLSGSKILFFSAYPMAKDNFIDQTKNSNSTISCASNEKEIDINSQAIVLENANEKLFHGALQKIKDQTDRIILIKNIELFNYEVVKSVITMKNLILSGNIDLCSQKELIYRKKYKTKIYFSTPFYGKVIKIPILKNYMGFMKNKTEEGLIYVKI